MPEYPTSPLPRSIPSVDWLRMGDDALASWIAWLATDLDLWNAGDAGYFTKGTDEDLLAAAYAERERRREVRLERIA